MVTGFRLAYLAAGGGGAYLAAGGGGACLAAGGGESPGLQAYGAHRVG